MRHQGKMGYGIGLIATAAAIAASDIPLVPTGKVKKVSKPKLIPQRDSKSKCSVCGRPFSTEDAFYHHAKAKHNA
jgi:hypothetical protein